MKKEPIVLWWVWNSHFSPEVWKLKSSVPPTLTAVKFTLFEIQKSNSWTKKILDRISRIFLELSSFQSCVTCTISRPCVTYISEKFFRVNFLLFLCYFYSDLKRGNQNDLQGKILKTIKSHFFLRTCLSLKLRKIFLLVVISCISSFAKLWEKMVWSLN